MPPSLWLLTLEHLLPLRDTLALQADLLQQERVDLLELHAVLVRKLLVVVLELLELALQGLLVLVDGLAKGGKDVELILVHQGH